jgi:hypothetical protein
MDLFMDPHQFIYWSINILVAVLHASSFTWEKLSKMRLEKDSMRVTSSVLLLIITIATHGPDRVFNMIGAKCPPLKTQKKNS